jgi:AraC-like DNA-binding protein
MDSRFRDVFTPRCVSGDARNDGVSGSAGVRIMTQPVNIAKRALRASIENRKELTSADITARMEGMERLLMQIASKLDTQAEFQTLLAQRVSDLRYLSIEEVAQARKCSKKTVRRRIAEGEFTLMQIPGTTEKGIPIMQVWPDRVDVRALATAEERDK